MERQIETLRQHYAGDAEAQAVLDHLAAEPELHRRHADFYAYEFFVVRRPAGGGRLTARAGKAATSSAPRR